MWVFKENNQCQDVWALQVMKDRNSGQSLEREEKLVKRFTWRQLLSGTAPFM